MALDLGKMFSKKGRKGKQSFDSETLTSLLLVVIVVLVIYFIFLDDRKRKNNKYIDVGMDASVGLNDNRRIGLDGDFELTNRKTGGNVGLRIGGAEDRVFADASVDYARRYGVNAGVGFGDGVDDPQYGVQAGYNSNDRALYLNVGELDEGFSNNNKLAPGPGKCALVFFYADWCGHCQRFKPEWNKFKNQMNNKKINGKVLVIMECSSDEEDLMKEYDINGYPTLKLLDANGREIKEFSDQRNSANLKNFVNSNM